MPIIGLAIDTRNNRQLTTYFQVVALILLSSLARYRKYIL